MTTYFTAPDGHGEPVLWARTDVTPTTSGTASMATVLPVIRRCDLGPNMRHHWDELVARVIAGPIMEWHVHQWSGAEGRGMQCKECGDRVWIGIDPPARKLIARRP